MVPRTVLIHDSFKQKLHIVNCVEIAEGEDLDKLYHEACRQIDGIAERLKLPLPYEFVESPAGKHEHSFSANMDQEGFQEMVRRAKEYILDGDIIQVVLSQRFHAKTRLSPFALYRALRHINPSPYLFYLQLGNVIQIGSSPEILVRLESGQIELVGEVIQPMRMAGNIEDPSVRQFLFDILCHALRVSARARDQVGRKPLIVVQQCLEDVLGHQSLVAFPCCDRLSGLHEPARPFRELFHVHRVSPLLKPPVLEAPKSGAPRSGSWD